MFIIDQLVEGWSYYGIFVLVCGINAAPFLVPPTWIVLASFHAAYPSFDPLYLALVGSTASVTGRFALMLLSSRSTRLMSAKRRTSLETIGKYLAGKKYAYFITSFLFALSPLPSNILFIGYGIMKRRSVGMFLGFWIGRVIAYFVMISASSVAFRPILNLFGENLVGIVAIDSLGLASIVVFACIDWEMLIMKRRLVFVKPTLRRSAA